MWYNKDKQGYSILLIIVVVSAVAVAITTSLLLLGIDSSRTSFAQEQSYQARSLANACAEEALQQIRNMTAYTGSGTISLGQGSCDYLVTNTGGLNRNIRASSTVGTIIRKVEIDIDAIEPDINIVSWQEKADF